MKRYFVLHPTVFKLDGGAMFGIIPRPLWSKKIAPDEHNRIEMALRVMLIQTAHRNILIDTGIGDYHGEKFDDRFGVKGPANPIINLLAQKNLNPNDITDIILTHLHFDHVGGLHSEELHLMFPNATLHIHQEHYNYALNPTDRDAGSFQSQYFKPLIEKYDAASKVHWIQGNEGVILNDGEDEIRFRISHGHTPFMIHPYDEKFIYMADLVPTSAHISVPWVMGYDIAAGQTTIDKKEFYEFILKNELTMIFEHDPLYWGSKLTLQKDFQPLDLRPGAGSDHQILELSFD
ncbi:MAG: MBL fold metallo-hydrolase [Bacteriovoracaceae bacterium]